MKSIKQTVLMAGVALAIAAGSFGASAANDKASFTRQMEMTDGNPGEYLQAQPAKPIVRSQRTSIFSKGIFSKTAAGPQATNAESRQFEDFENQLTAGDEVPGYTPSEHTADGK